MDEITRLLRDHYARTFEQFGATARGVDWGEEQELQLRYDKMLAVLQKDFYGPEDVPSLLDVGCGWGGLARRVREVGLELRYTGIDVVQAMVEHGRRESPDAEFILGDVLSIGGERKWDFAVCNAILTQKLAVSIPEMERYAKRLVRKMFELAQHGIAFNMMSTRVNFMVENLYYQNPADMLAWCLEEISPRVRLDHGYSSLASGRGRFYDFTLYIFKD